MFARLICALATTVMVLIPSAVSAQTYPTKPIRLIIPFSPGGTNDILGRMIGVHLAEAWGQTVIPDNRPGHQGIIGTNIAAKADPDGYTLVVISAAYTMNPITEEMPFDPVKALDFVMRIGQSVLIMNVGPLLPDVKSVKDLLDEAARKPGDVVLSSSGGFMYFATALFESLSKKDFNIVLYKGGFPAMMDVIGGRVHAGFAVSTYVLPQIRAGKLRAIGVGTPNRFELLPDVPTLDEAGIKGYDASNWYAIAAPAGTPKPIMTKLHEELKRFFTSAKTVKTLEESGVNISIKTTEEMRRIVPAEIDKWTKIAIAAGMPGVRKK